MHRVFVRSLLLVAMIGHALLGCPAHHAHGAAVVHFHHSVVHCHNHDAQGRVRDSKASADSTAVRGQAVAAVTLIELDQALSLAQPRRSHAPCDAAQRSYSLPCQESPTPGEHDLCVIDRLLSDATGTLKTRSVGHGPRGGFATRFPASSSTQQWLGRWLV